MSEFDSRDDQPGPGAEPGQPAEKDTMSAEHDDSLELTTQYRVGDELRMRRESMGKSIADVVDAVRIQGRYLEALEESRTGDLPGNVYALGFVRTYAEYLGLDGAEMVSRYKEETQGLKSDPSLTMPEPIAEAKAPTAAILLIAVLLAALGYGVWYFLSKQDGWIAQVVPDVPEHLAATVADAGTASPEAGPSAVGESVEAATAAIPATAAAPVKPPDSGEGDKPPPAAGNGAASPETITPAALPALPPVEAAPLPVVETAAMQQAEPAERTLEPSPVAVETQTSALEAPPIDVAVMQPPAVLEREAPSSVPEAIPIVPLVEEAPHEPKVFGLGNTNARIVIIALEDAWVEVTDSDSARLFSRVLRKGDSYRAPNRQGAKFVTGNAGGLDITVDGETTPTLGPSGQVRRDVKLDPDLLKAGRAWP